MKDPRFLSNQDLRDPQVLAGLRRSVFSALEQRSPHPLLLLQLVRLNRAMGDLDAAERACAEYARVHGPHAETDRLLCLLRGQPEAVARSPRVGAAPFLRLVNVLPAADQAAVWSVLDQAQGALSAANVKWRGGQGVFDEIRRALRMPAPPEALKRLTPALRGAIERSRLSSAFDLDPPPTGRIEGEVVCHTEGGRFGRHADDAYGSVGRVLTCVYYLHRQPARFTGGDLLLHDAKSDDRPEDPIGFTRFRPEHNTAVIFPAHVDHEVTIVHSDVTNPLEGRVSINVWLHASATHPSGSAQP